MSEGTYIVLEYDDYDLEWKLCLHDESENKVLRYLASECLDQPDCDKTLKRFRVIRTESDVSADLFTSKDKLSDHIENLIAEREAYRKKYEEERKRREYESYLKLKEKYERPSLIQEIGKL